MDYVLCNAESLRDCSDKLKSSKEKSDALIERIGKKASALTECQWLGQESAVFMEEFKAFEQQYNEFREQYDLLSKHMDSFAEEVESTDKLFSNKFSSI